MAEEYKAKKVRVVGVSKDPVPANGKFASDCGFSYPLLSDESGTISVAYGAAASTSDAKASRIAVLIDRDGKIAKVWPTVDAKTFPQTALAELKEPLPPPPPYVKPNPMTPHGFPTGETMKCEFCGFKWNTVAYDKFDKYGCPKCLAKPKPPAAA